MASDSFGPTALVTPANAITVARLVLTPLFLAAIIGGGASYVALVCWILLASTDGVDGFVARRQGTTRSGAFLDPLADKFLVIGALVVLAAEGAFSWLPVAIIAVREVAISVYRTWLSRRGVSVPAVWWAKVKTVVQTVAVALALLPPVATGAGWLPRIVLWFAALVAVVTGVQYLQGGRRSSHAL